MSEQDDADVVERVPRQFSFPALPWLPALRGIVSVGRRRVVAIATGCALLLTAATASQRSFTSPPSTAPTARWRTGR